MLRTRTSQSGIHRVKVARL